MRTRVPTSDVPTRGSNAPAKPSVKRVDENRVPAATSGLKSEFFRKRRPGLHRDHGKLIARLQTAIGDTDDEPVCGQAQEGRRIEREQSIDVLERCSRLAGVCP